jgi:enoyl-CoA hydratase
MSLFVERHGAVTTIIINRPEVRNAVNPITAQALIAAFEIFDSDDTQSVAVLCGAGGTFCAGADLHAVSQHIDEWNLTDTGKNGPLGPSRMRLSKPVIAAVDGYAVAGGLELALWCDMRVVEADATFGVFCRRWGVPLIDGGTVRLPRLIGHSRAMDMILTGRPVGADEALQWGLANRVVAKGHKSPPSRSAACARIGSRATASGAWIKARRSVTSFAAARR